MKKTLLPILVGAIAATGWTLSAAAQDDPAVTIEPEAEVTTSQDASGGVIYSGGGYVQDATGRHADRGPIGWIVHPMLDRVHPHPVYAHSRAGAVATWTHGWNEQQAMMRSWHGGYYHYQYGAPVALVVPPTAAFQTNWSWGVGRTTSTPIYHQFARPYPGPASGGPHYLQRTPTWPSNTNQFGIYPVRGPW